MEIKFSNVTKENRKSLVQAVSDCIGCKPIYQCAPSFAFAVKNYVVDRYGTLICDERTNEEEVQRLMLHLSGEVFVRDSDTEPPEAPPLKTITVDMPFFNDTALDNLRKLIDGKASLIKKSIGTNDLTVAVVGGAVHFNWFSPNSADSELEAYRQFVSALCVTAKNQKRVTMKESSVDSEKFAFRCFLLKLGFIGAKYASARKILLANLSGNGSFKSGDQKSRSVQSSSVSEKNIEEVDGNV